MIPHKRRRLSASTYARERAMRLIRYNDLVEKGVVNSRMTLKRLIDSHGFPPGKLITPNARAWEEVEVDAWIANWPVARKTATHKTAARA
jgi:predicted DNA-binding transcriptional regulator AlpA